MQPAGHEEPVQERVCFVGESHRKEGRDPDARVPWPRVSVVPVPLATELFGERRGRGGHRSPGGGVREEPKRDQAAGHCLDGRSRVLDPRGPPLPPTIRVVQQLECLIGRNEDERVSIRDPQHHGQRAARLEGDGLLLAGDQVHMGRCVQGHRQRPPLAHQRPRGHSLPTR